MKLWKKSSAVIAILVTALTLYGMAKRPSRKEGKVLARVNDEVLTLEEFNNKFAKIKLPPKRRGMGREMKEDIVERWVEQQLLFQEAKQRGIDRRADFLERLEQMKKDMAIQTLLQDEMKKIEVSEEEIAKYFEKHRQQFQIPERLKARHILVKTEEEAKEILRRLNEGENFEKLAKELSIDNRTKRRGGSLGFGFVSRRQCRRYYGPAFEKAAFSLKAGEISQPVKSRLGYHLIKVEEKREGRTQTLDEVRDRVERMALGEKQRKARHDLIESLKEKADIEINLGLLSPSEEEVLKKESK